MVKLSQSSPFNLLCDESNKLGDSKKFLTILVRLFELNNRIIFTRHLDAVGITDLYTQGIFIWLQRRLCTNMAFLLKIFLVLLVDVNCVCHVVNLCVKSAVKVIPLKVDELLIDIFCSVKRVTTLREYAEFCATEFKCILKHYESRWLLRRAISCTSDMMLDRLLPYFTSHADVEKYGKVHSIFKLLNDPLLKYGLIFF